jgi:Tfp pilus assembly protein PilN
MYAKEQETLQAGIRAGQAGAGTMMTNMAQDLDTVRAQLAQREHLLEELQRGLLREGQGHSVRMRMVAQTIPAQVWVTEVLAEEKKLEVRGFTLEPVALDEWVARLALNPGLQGQTLSAIKVERVTEEAKDVPAGAAKALPTWAFTLVSSVLASSSNAAGGRP